MRSVRLRALSLAGIMLPCVVFLFGCKKGSEIENQAPETYISLKSINLSGENRLNSVVKLAWWGTDPDGIVEGYELSFDQEVWTYTASQDSTFLFSINAGSDTVDITLWVRAVDGEGLTDPSPATLVIPLKNTPPEAAFTRTLIPMDTAFNAVTLLWTASDLDGIETIDKIQLKINEGDWLDLNKTVRMVSVSPTDAKANGSVSSGVYMDFSEPIATIEGLLLNDLNSFYIRALDIAGSASKVDTLSGLFVRGQTNDVLVIGANSASPNNFYRNELMTAGVQADFIDFISSDGKNQPLIWNPTFGLLLDKYKTVVMYTNDVKFTNAQTNGEDILLEFASTALQTYIDRGGKLLITTSFPNGFSTGSALFGILPIDSLSTSVGQARLPIDSLAEGLLSGYPDLTCNSFISGLDPIYPSSDATPIYSAQLTRNNGWSGPSTIGVRRTAAGKTNFVFFSVELHKLNKDQAAVSDLFGHIFNTEFNW